MLRLEIDHLSIDAASSARFVWAEQQISSALEFKF